MADVSDLGVSAEQAARQARRLGVWARVVLVPVAVIGAVLSFQSLYQAAVPTFGDYLAAGFPLLVDLLILGASLQYVAGAKIGRPMAGWRLTAHAGVGGTLVLNALAAKELGEVPWHITAPAVWAVLVELTAKQVLGEWKATHSARADTISLPLWMTAPIESIRTRLLMFRTGITDAHKARIAVGVNAAAREALRLALPKRNARRVRKIINRQLRAGSLTPVAILRPLGWTKGGVVLNDARPDVILQAVLQEVLDPSAPPAPIAHAAPQVAQQPQVVEYAPPAQPAGPVQYPDPDATPPSGVGPQPEVAQPGLARRPGSVQQPARALQLGRALHRGRVLHQAGPADMSSTAAEQLQSELLTRMQAPGPQAGQQTEQFSQVEHQMQDPWAAERAGRPVEPFLAPTAVLNVDNSRKVAAGKMDERPDISLFDHTEILDDMEHLDDLDGQEYPEDLDGLDGGDYVDLDDSSRRGEPVPRGSRQ